MAPLGSSYGDFMRSCSPPETSVYLVFTEEVNLAIHVGFRISRYQQAPTQGRLPRHRGGLCCSELITCLQFREKQRLSANEVTLGVPERGSVLLSRDLEPMDTFIFSVQLLC